MRYRFIITALLALTALAVPAAVASAAPSTGAIVFSMVTEDKRVQKDAEGKVLPPKGPEGGIFAVRSRNLNQLTEDPADTEPSFSADGRTIAFARGGDIFTMRADGSGQRRLTSGPEIDSRPQVSPNSRFVLFERSSVADGQRDLYTVRVNGGPAHAFAVTLFDEHEASISPNGSSVVFVRSTVEASGDTADDLYVARPSGAERRRLTRTPGVDEFAPRNLVAQVVYSRGESSKGPSAYADIYSMDRKGQQVRKVIAGAGSSYVEDATASGRTLLIRRDLGLWVRPFAGKGRLLTDLPDNSETNSVFSSDGKHVAAFTSGDEGQAISVIEVSSGRASYAVTVSGNASSESEVTTTIGPIIAWQPVPRR